MRAAVLVAPGTRLQMMDVDVPAPRAGQVLVKLAYSGVCHSQLMEVRGLRGPDPYVPHLLGHEGSGRVEAVGEGVSKVRPGDRVVLTWIKGAGLDGGGVQYRRGDAIINAGGVTTFNEYAVVSENRCVALPDGVRPDIAVLFGCALPTGAGMVINELRPRSDTSIAIYGMGGVGLSAVIATRLYAFSAVIAVDISDEKLVLARSFGASHTVNALEKAPVDAVRALTDGRGADYAIDASGRPDVIEMAFESVCRNGGLCVFASHPQSGAKIRLDPYDLICGKQIQGSWGGASRPDTDVPRLAALLVDKSLLLEKMLTRRYPLERINDALDDLQAGRVNRPLIEIDPSMG